MLLKQSHEPRLSRSDAIGRALGLSTEQLRLIE
jgi:hypothetical protein